MSHVIQSLVARFDEAKLTFDNAKRVLYLCPDFTEALDNQPFHVRVFQFFPFLCALIIGIAVNEFLFSVQHIIQLVQVMFVAFLGLMHIWVTLIVFILSEARYFDYGGIDQRSLRHYHATVRQPLVNGIK